MRSFSRMKRRATVGSGRIEAMASGRRRRTIEMVIESLERRIVLSPVTWDGGTGNWNDMTRWSDNRVPGGSDDVVIPAGSDVMITTNVSASTLMAATSSTVDLTSTGMLSVNNGGTIDGSFTWAGTLDGGSTTLSFGGSTVVTGGTQGGDFVNNGNMSFGGGSFFASTVTNNGTMTVNNGGIVLGEGVTLTNATNATFTIADDGSFVPTTDPGITTGTFINEGTFTKSGGSGTSVFSDIPSSNGNYSGEFENVGGTININSGNFTINSSAAFQGGSINVKTGSTFTLDAGSSNGPNNVELSGIIDGTGGGSIDLTAGSYFAQSPTGTSADATLDLTAATVDVGDVLFQQAGNSTLTNTGTLNLISDTGNGPLNMINEGTVNILGTSDVPMQNFVNGQNGTLNLETNANITSGRGNIDLTNKGLIRKSVGTGTSVFTASFLNDAGVLEIDSGTISFQEGTLGYLAGPLDIAAGASLQFETSNAVSIQGTLSSSGGGTVKQTTGWFAGPSTYWGEDPTKNGTLDFAPGTLTLDGGYLDQGTSTLINSGTIDEVGDNQTGTFTNSGTIDFDAGAVDLRGNIINLPTGTIEFTNTAVTSGTSTTIDNQGKIIANATTGPLNLATALPYNPYQSRPSLTNTGIFEVASGTVIYPSVSLGSGQNIASGTYQVDPGATLTTEVPVSIAENDGSVILGGAGSSFPDINSLSINKGTLQVLSGASFTAPGNLTNEGTLSVGGSVKIIGNFVQSLASGTPTLDFPIAALPGSSSAPSLTVSGIATLAGHLKAEYSSGFSAAASSSYKVAHFASAAMATFASTSGVGPTFNVSVNPTSIVLDGTAAGSVDLGAVGVTAPQTFTPGQYATITWQVTEQGTGFANGSWQDSVYLTKNGVINGAAILLGRVAHSTTVAPGAGYLGTLQAIMPAAANGSYQVVVLVDSLLQLNDANRANNQVDSTPISSVIPSLTLGSTTSDTIFFTQDRLYQLQLGAGSDVTLNAGFPNGYGANIYVSYNAIPSTSSSDEYVRGTASKSESLPIPVHQAGTYYVLVEGGVSHGPQPFTLTPTLIPPSISGVSPRMSGNQGNVTVEIDGSGFKGVTSATLNGPLAIPGTNLIYVSSNKIFATFDVQGATPGNYSISVEDGQSSLTLPVAFTVQAPSSGTTGLRIQLLTSSNFRGNDDTELLLEVTNTSNIDIPSPYIAITSNNAKFRLPDQTGYSNDYIELLATNSTGPASVIPPGASLQFPVLYQQLLELPHNEVTLNATVLDDQYDVTYLGDLAQSLQPAGEPDAAWNIIYNNFLDMVGTTVGGFDQVLRNAADVLSSQGTYSDDPAVLMDYALQEADNFGAITQRFTTGAFGLGQVDPIDLTLTTQGNGNVIITSSGQQRVFLDAGDGKYFGTGADAATLTLDTKANAYTLKETDGQVEVFNPNGTLNYYQDTNGNRLTAIYTGSELTSMVATNGDTYTYTYNSDGHISKVIDPVGQVTTYGYDPTGQLLTSITTSTGTTNYTYVTTPGLASLNAIASITYPDGVVENYTYDTLGRLIGQSFNNGQDPTTYSYQASGVETETDAMGNVTTYVQGPSGTTTQVENALGQVASTAYASNGLPTSTTSPGGQTSATYDANGNPNSITDPLGNVTNLTYSATLNDLISLTDANDNTTSYAYNAQGNEVSQTDAAGHVTTYQYDATGNLTQTINPDGTAVSVQYNAQNLVTRETYSDGSTVTFIYDSHRNLLSADDSATGTVADTYNAANEVTSVTYPTGLSLHYSYSASGQLIQTLDQTGFVTNYLYNDLDLLAELTDGSGKVIATYAYNADEELASKVNANGTSTVYTYDASGDVLSIINKSPSGAIDSSFAYVYNPAGDRISMTTTTGTTYYSYDADNQLIKVILPGGRTIVYAYDGVGNRATVSDSAVSSVTYSTNNLDEYVQVGDTTYTYDQDGNLLSSTTAGVTTSYTYNAQGMLASETTPTNTITYQYDALGDRISMTDNGVVTYELVSPAAGGSVVGTFNSTVAVLDHYVYGLGLTSQVSASNVASFYDFDASGNTADVTGASGLVSNTYRYLPFGQILTSTGSGSNLFTFAGQVGVENSPGGLYYMQARFYDPTTGRFTQKDPTGLSGGDSNFYRYAQNNPVNEVDPSGQAPYGFTLASLENTLALARSGAILLTKADGAAITNGVIELEKSLIFDAAWQREVAGTLLRQGFYAAIEASPGFAADVALIKPAVTRIVVGADAVTFAPATELFYTRVGLALAFDLSLPVAAGYELNKQLNDLLYLKYKYPEELNKVANDAINPDRYTNIKNPIILGSIAAYYKQTKMYPSPYLIDTWIKAYNDFQHNEEIKRLKLRTGTGSEADYSFDPNNLLGPGYGSQGFVAAGDVSPYQIEFTNDSTATAPAQTVTVTEQLDANLDWSTFQFGTIQFGSTTINVPAGLNSNQTTVSLGSAIEVEIAANLNLLTGLVTWTFTSIDPSTGDLPANPLSGFLPPDDAARDGEGYVDYTVKPRSSLGSGTSFISKASIVFDTNAAIATPQLLNTIDSIAPSSVVTPLPATVDTPNIPLSWSGQDDAEGSGIALYLVYVSIDGSAFFPWTSTSSTSAVYPGTLGHTYAFYTLAQDNVGNIQANPTATTSTMVVPVTTTGGGGGGSQGGSGGGSRGTTVAPPVATIAGPSRAIAGLIYTLGLSAAGTAAAAITNWTVNWGDGSIQTLPGNPSSVVHVFQTGPRSETITATATGAFGTVASNVLRVAVAGSNAPVVSIPSPTPAVANVLYFGSGSFKTSQRGPFKATINDGDGSTPQALKIGSNHTFTFNHVYKSPGSYVVTISVEDGGHHLGQYVATINVSPPIASGYGAGRDAFVTTLFLEDLGHVPAGPGLAYWSKKLATGTHPSTVAKDFYDSTTRKSLASHHEIPRLTDKTTYANAQEASKVAIQHQKKTPRGPKPLIPAAAKTKAHSTRK